MKRLIVTKTFAENPVTHVEFCTNKMGITFTAWVYETRSSWGHKIRMSIHDRKLEKYDYVEKKITYYNRTWESYRFQSIIHTAIHSLIKDYKTAKHYCDLLDKYLRKEGL